MTPLVFLLATLLPTGLKLDPAGTAIPLGNMPLAMVLAPRGDKVIVSLSGWREQGLQVVDLATKRVTQTIPLNAAFIGLTFADHETLYASGGFSDVVYQYSWNGETLTAKGQIPLYDDQPHQPGARYPTGLAMSRKGKLLYVAENVADRLAVIDPEGRRVVQRFPTDHYPYAVAVGPDGSVYVSAWGDRTVCMFHSDSEGRLAPAGRLTIGRHPSSLLLDRGGSRLLVTLSDEDRVATVDTKRRRIIGYLDTSAPSGPHEGATPNAIAFSDDERAVYVADADSNDVAVFRLEDRRLIGRIPTDWYPVGVLRHGADLLVLNAKGAGTAPNRTGPTPDKPLDKIDPQYVLGQLTGNIRIVRLPQQLASTTRRVTEANGWNRASVKRRYPPFKHVIYIIKENRTYDQLLGDLAQGDGDPTLLFFSRGGSPNHHALAERFGIFDRFFTNAEVSQQGHIWSTAAYVTEYGEKTVPSLYARKRSDVDEGEVDEPAAGFLWTLALKKGITLRVYGEFAQATSPQNVAFRSLKAPLVADTSPDYPSFDMSIPDQRRADVWIREFNEFVRRGEMPALEILHLPNDHTAGGRAGRPTPRSCMADNDLALGRIVEALSNSPFWRDTVMFVLEDDAQDGADHVDSHRAPLFVISAYNRPGLRRRFTNTTDVVATIEDILGLERLSQFDAFGRPLAAVFADQADLTPYKALLPDVPLNELNPSEGAPAHASANLDLSRPDAIDDMQFNRILWMTIKGTPYPNIPHAKPIELLFDVR